eukprot:CAMPEP_0170573856 /NCGR_PEP_ID=MMETSP0224-20130122/2989_1 /TAXON_ID=285029 /ORGANISM="Togula jolla, Strain CCCM 725" /LENGTH=402 /DNA_ID=CAMNT_0010896473 /DNA_START=82 /DNA_END=1290 /DNA_ORIENTATION=-
MNSTTSGSSSSSSMKVPVLTLLDSTAPRTARTHDISHLRDRSTHLAPILPESLIAEHDHRYESDFMPRDSSSKYSQEDGLWHARVFPSDQPSSRTDAVQLDAWITRCLERYQQSSSCETKEELARAVEDLVPILSVGLHEVARQITHHCGERGVVFEKIWRTYVELFDRVLRQMQSSLQAQKQRTLEVQKELGVSRAELQEMKRGHPERMHAVIAELEGNFTLRQEFLEEELLASGAENMKLKQELQDHQTELETWYPSFQGYQDSYIKGQVPHYGASSASRGRGPRRLPDGGEAQEAMLPEEAVAEDFKRLLAVLAPEKRKVIGQEVSHIMNASTAKAPATATAKKAPTKGAKTRLSPPPTSQEAAEKEDNQKVQRLQAEVREQEERITKLREEIARLEAS